MIDGTANDHAAGDLLARLQQDDFAPLLNQHFDIVAKDGAAPVKAQLVAVDSLIHSAGASIQPPSRRPFSLLFRTPPNAYLAQRCYTVQHPQLGPMSIFLVPVAPDEHGLCYEAVFS